MKNLIKAVTEEQRNELEKFIFSINEVTDREKLTSKYGYYSDLFPQGKKTDQMSMSELKAYLITRKEKSVNKAIERKVDRIKTVFAAGELISVKISIEWKNSRTWGANPKGEAWATFKDENGNNSNYVQSGSISGCGYDKLSTAVAECLNQFNEVLKLLYTVKDAILATHNKKNHEIFGYGSGYGILPAIEGGVGISCYPEIFSKVGYNFRSVASGKTFDVFEITKS